MKKRLGLNRKFHIGPFAFTLTEVMVALAIIALILLVVMSIYQRVTRSTMQVKLTTLATSNTIERATGLIAGPVSPPTILPKRGVLWSILIAMP